MFVFQYANQNTPYRNYYVAVMLFDYTRKVIYDVDYNDFYDRANKMTFFQIYMTLDHTNFLLFINRYTTLYNFNGSQD